MEIIKTEEKSDKIFRLYDGAIWIVGIGLIFLTYKALGSSKSFDQKLLSLPGILWVWVMVLLKVYIINVRDEKTLIFQGLFRKIIVQPQEIIEFQEWIRGARLVYKGGSIILWPYIENQDQFKSMLKTINPNIIFRDIAEEGTKTGARVTIILLGVFAYFGWLIWSLFNGIPKSFK